MRAKTQKESFMEKMTVQVEVAKEAYELGLVLALLVKKTREALKDGLGPEDIPTLLSVFISKEFTEGVQGLDKLGAEVKEDSAAVVSALVVAGTKIASDLKA